MINRKRVQEDLNALARFTDTPGAGVTRYSYTDNDSRARRYIGDILTAYGLKVRTDGIGNIRAERPGAETDAPKILTGSHIDTVQNGGPLDGSLGVVGALETIRTLCERNVQTRCGVELIIFAEEEGSNFQTTMVGSKSMTGRLTDKDLDLLLDSQQKTMRQRLEAFGIIPGTSTTSRVNSAEIKAMVELHIEQASVLEHDGFPIGIVEKIAGMRSYLVSLKGVGNHAGATPMDLRQDALTAAAEMILAVKDAATVHLGSDAVATVGKINCLPNAANVIPESVEFTIDVRDVESKILESVSAEIVSRMKSIARQQNIKIEIRQIGSSSPGSLSPLVIGALEDAAGEQGISYRRINSGAVHDSCIISEQMEAGMIFVPSIGGRSHVPEENTDWDDIFTGCDLLYHTVIKLAG